MTAQRKTKSPTRAQTIAIDTPVDYSTNMFKDGNNRTKNNPDIRGAKGYDEAAHEGDAQFDLSVDASEISELVSMDGAFASEKINADEEGVPLGGTEEEIDAMEVEGKPVDRTDRMKY